MAGDVRAQESPPLTATPTLARISHGSETRKRQEQVLVRFTTDELAEARDLAARNQMTVPELLRTCLLAVQIEEARNG